MKKSLVALAALAVSGAAMAQVTIGGIVDRLITLLTKRAVQAF